MIFKVHSYSSLSTISRKKKFVRFIRIFLVDLLIWPLFHVVGDIDIVFFSRVINLTYICQDSSHRRRFVTILFIIRTNFIDNFLKCSPVNIFHEKMKKQPVTEVLVDGAQTVPLHPALINSEIKNNLIKILSHFLSIFTLICFCIWKILSRGQNQWQLQYTEARNVPIKRNKNLYKILMTLTYIQQYIMLSMLNQFTGFTRMTERSIFCHWGCLEEVDTLHQSWLLSLRPHI